MNKNKLGYDFDKPNKDEVYAVPRAYEFTYYLSDCVQDTHEYHELLQLLDSASENDLVRIVINNFGGEAGTCIQICSAIRECKAEVVGHLSGNAFSAAGVIWLACHQQEISKHSMLMIHTAVGGASGKYSDMANYINITNKRTELLYQDIFKHFLTNEEISAVMKGEEIWLLDDDIITRLNHRQNALAKEQAEQRTQEFNEMQALFEDENDVPVEILAKVTKADLIRYIEGKIDIMSDENGKPLIVELDIDKVE